MKILIDTNVLIDSIITREPFTEQATKLMIKCASKEIEGYIAVHSILNMFFILRKEIPDADERRDQLLDLTVFLDVVEVDKTIIAASLKNRSFKDFEDCVQSECAVRAGANYIVTRNVKDYASSPVKAVTPDDFLNIVQNL